MRSDGRSRLLLGNLDAEVEMSGGGALKARVLSRIAALSALMRAFADQGDALAIPGSNLAGGQGPSAGQDPTACLVLPPVMGLADPEVTTIHSVTSGSHKNREWAAVLPWAWTESARQIERRSGNIPSDGLVPGPFRGGRELLHRAVWQCSSADPRQVVHSHDRRFAAEIAENHGWGLPGTKCVDSVEDLLRRLPAIREAGFERFVLKAPLSASGRDRVVASIDEAGDSVLGNRVTAFLARFGGGVLEPYCERTADYGACAFVTPDGVDLRTIHRLENDPRDGRFLGATLAADPVCPIGLSRADRAQLIEVVEVVGGKLGSNGYLGPFGVDAFSYGRANSEVFHPLCEINVRLTMGFALATLVERVAWGGASLRLGSDEERPEMGLPIVQSPYVSAWLEPIAVAKDPVSPLW